MKINDLRRPPRRHARATHGRLVLALSVVLASCAAKDAATDPGGPAAGNPATQPVTGSGTGGSFAGSGGSAGAVVGGQPPPAGSAGSNGTAGAQPGGAMQPSAKPDAGGTTPSDAGAALDAGEDTTRDAGAIEPGTVEDSGEDCPIPELPAPAQLNAFAKHHDPFTKLDGSRITSKADWRCRRAEIKAQLERYESGEKPAVPRADTTAELSGNTLAITVKANGKSIRFSVSIGRPAGMTADPAPLLIAYGIQTLDRTVFTQNGVATIVFDIGSMGAQSGPGSRGTGLFYDLYGRDHTASSMVAWAWGVSRIIDAIEQTPEAKLDPRRVAVTGCSRNGKGALLAGALDERIALTIPQESGAGGSASWRVSQAQSQQGENVQTLSSAANEQPWFRADFAASFGGSNVTKLPFDHHMVMGLVAPRALLVLDNRIDWLGIDSTFTAGSIAHHIWQAFGRADHMAYWQTGGHSHCQFPAAQRELLNAYVQKFLVGTGTADTNMLRAENAEADLTSWMDWTPPMLSGDEP